MKYLLLLISLICLSINVNAADKYIVFLKDKKDSPFKISQPQAYLSSRAIERRAKQNIIIDSSDFPINPAYIQGIKASGAVIINRSRWYNFVQIVADSTQVANLSNLNYVKNIQKVFGSGLKIRTPRTKTGKLGQRTQSIYGGAESQVKMIKADLLHNMNYRGQGMVIAVMDAGFQNYTNLAAFDSLYADGSILGTYDFVTNDASVVEDDNHGTNVLSCMAANVPNTMVGTAPKAAYWLLRTEDAPTEYIIEEYNWVAGVEFADSVGADLVNSSLGYTTFDASSQNHTYNDMNGTTAISSLAATKAVSKGMVIVVSAGNEGNSSWRYIASPADAKDILAIGAVSSSREIAGFSSRGPSVDDRIKPNVCAQGQEAYIAYTTSGNYGPSNGTSFSGPIMAGAVACLWQSTPNKTAFEIMRAVEASADKFLTPDGDYGYGIPDLYKAFINLNDTQGVNQEKYNRKITLSPNPTKDILKITYLAETETSVVLTMINTLGQLVRKETIPVNAVTFNNFEVLISNLESGNYFINISSGQSNVVRKVVIE